MTRIAPTSTTLTQHNITSTFLNTPSFNKPTPHFIHGPNTIATITTAPAAPASSHRRSIVCQAGFGRAQPAKKTLPQSCPCGSNKPYKDCCKPYHDGTKLPETAEQLMRSRYSAYAKELPTYIVETTHPLNPLHPDSIDSGAESTLRDDVVATCKKINWEKLKILEVKGGRDENEGWVTFQTFFKVRGQEGQRAQGWNTQTFIEKSHFLRENGKWLYVNGDQDWEVGKS